MKITIILVVAFFVVPCIIFGAPATAEKKPGATVKAQPPKDIFANLKRGDRVTIILNNDATFSGEIKNIVKDKIEIDVSYEEFGLTGTIAFDRKDIKAIINLQPLDDSTKKEIKSQKKTAAKKYQAELPRKEASTGVTEAEETKSQDEEVLLLSLLDKFPPGKAWNKQRYEEINATAFYLQTDEEKEFINQYELWLKAQAFKEKIDRRALRQKFLPGNGWSEEKFKDLSTKFVRTGVALSAEEHEFINKYPDWIKAQAEYEEEQKEEEEAKKDSLRSSSEESKTPAPAE